MKEEMLDRIDALLHPAPGAADAAMTDSPPPDWLPVLTDVIERGQLPETATPPPAAPTPDVPESPAVSESPAAEPMEAAIPVPDPLAADALAAELMNALAPKLSALIETRVGALLRRDLDETLATLLGQLDSHLRDIVREAITDKLAAREQQDR